MNKILLSVFFILNIILNTSAFGASSGKMGRFLIGPYASISSTKSIKAKKNTNNSEEVTTQRINYGIKVDLDILRFISLGVTVGTNKVDTTKKAVAMKDEFSEIDFNKDAKVNPDQGGDYRYQEEQRIGNVILNLNLNLMSFLTLKAGVGVRARQRLIDITDNVNNTLNSIHDPIRYHAIANSGFNLRIFRMLNFGMEYKFYFVKFPKTEPHEQEVLVNFSISI